MVSLSFSTYLADVDKALQKRNESFRTTDAKFNEIAEHWSNEVDPEVVADSLIKTETMVIFQIPWMDVHSNSKLRKALGGLLDQSTLFNHDLHFSVTKAEFAEFIIRRNDPGTKALNAQIVRRPTRYATH